jgi:hypothetical protein
MVSLHLLIEQTVGDLGVGGVPSEPKRSSINQTIQIMYIEVL